MHAILIRISLLFIFVFPFIALNAQPYMEKRFDNRVNVNDLIRESDAWYQENGTGKGKGFKGYNRWKWAMERRFFPTGDRSNFDPQIAQKEMAAFKSANRRAAANGFWVYRGPDYADNILPPSWAAGLGRVEAVWAGAANADTVYLGSRSGGFWKTIDGGQTWRSTTQDQEALGVVDIEVHPDRRNEVWILTLHPTGYSYGLLKSTDFGETWNTTSLAWTIGNATGNEMVIASADTFFVATNIGVFRSTDAGNTWANVQSGNVIEMKAHPTNSQIIYTIRSGSNNILRRTTDGGQTWNSITISGNTGRPFICTSLASPDLIYLGSSSGIFKSTDAGLNWTLQSNDPTNSGVMSLGASATNPNILFAGSLTHYKSTDGGLTWNIFADWVNYNGPNYVHADGRVMRAWGNRIYFGTDGFLGYSPDNGNTFSKINNGGTGIREFYRIGCSPMKADAAVGGSQDNGTSVMRDGDWAEWIGADGMEAHFDRNNPEVWFGTIQFGSLQRTNQNGQNAQGIAPDTDGAWITPSVIDPNNQNTIFIAFDTLYKSNDNGDHWQVQAAFNNGNFDDLAISPSDSNVLYISKSNVIRRSTDNGHTWTFINAGLPNLFITDINVHPTDPMQVAISMSGFMGGNKVFYSTNGGNNWSNISGNLPNLPANAIAFTEDQPAQMILGMDVGVFYAEANTNAWTFYSDSLPAAAINDIEILEGAGLIRVGTWGRGIWEAAIPGHEGKPQIVEIIMNPKEIDQHPTSNESVEVKARIQSNSAIANATLHWGLSTTSQSNIIPMQTLAADTFITTLPIPAMAIGTRVYFRIHATASNGDSVISDRIMYKVKKGELCAATGAQGTTFDFIDTVQVGNMINPSGQDYYGNFRNIFAEVFRDSSYTLMSSLNYSFPLDSMYLWIDWNNNFDLSDAGEQIIMSEIDAQHNSYGNFVVPHLSNIPDTIVMRIRSIYSSTQIADPCGSYFGEVEDYSIIVRDPSVVIAVEPKTLPEFRCYPNPSKNAVWIEWPSDYPRPELPWQIFDLNGKSILAGKIDSVNEGKAKLDVSTLANGLYILDLGSGSWKTRIGIMK